MKLMTATEASRRFSDVLDMVEHGETIAITRGGHRIAVLAPAPGATVGDIAAAMRRTPVDETFASDIASALELVSEDSDPWLGD